MDAKILVVDDNDNVRRTVKSVLKSKEPTIQVSEAASGKEALKLMEKMEPDLILLDIMMPEMNGWDVAAEMKSNNRLKEIPIIYLTAKEDELSKMMGDLSAEDYITKPFDNNDLVQRIKDVLVKMSYVKDKLKRSR